MQAEDPQDTTAEFYPLLAEFNWHPHAKFLQDPF
jgi:hypothetical protein